MIRAKVHKEYPFKLFFTVKKKINTHHEMKKLNNSCQQRKPFLDLIRGT